MGTSFKEELYFHKAQIDQLAAARQRISEGKPAFEQSVSASEAVEELEAVKVVRGVTAEELRGFMDSEMIRSV